MTETRESIDKLRRRRRRRRTDADPEPLQNQKNADGDGGDEPTTTATTKTNDRTEAAALARKKHGIRVKGASGSNSSDIPPPLDCFAPALRRAPEARGVRAALERNLAAQGWLDPTPIQRQIVPLLSRGREVLAIAPTGSGKTLAFLLPIVVGCARAREKERKRQRQQKEIKGKGSSFLSSSSSFPRALVLSPTRELAAQTARVLSKLAEGTEVKGKMLTRGAAAAGASFEGVDVLLATPLRLARALAKKRNNKRGESKKKKKKKGGSSSSSSDEQEEEGDLDTSDDNDDAFCAPSSSSSPSLSLSSVRWIVLDEADRLLSDGMLPQVDAALAACGVGSDEERSERKKTKKKKKNLVGALFSATLPEATEALARSFLVDPARVTVGERGASASHVEQKLVFVGGGGGGGGEGGEKRGGKRVGAEAATSQDDVGRRAALRQLLSSGAAPPPALVFVSSAERAAELAESLAAEGVRAAAATGGGAGRGGGGGGRGGEGTDPSSPSLSATAARAAAVASLRRGDTWVLVATDVLARGLDFVGVRSVVSFDFPATASDYVHRVGRVGRAGAKGCVALTFFGESDASQLRPVAGAMRAAGCEVPDWMLSLAPPGKRERREAKRRSVGGGGGGGGRGRGGARKKRSKK